MRKRKPCGKCGGLERNKHGQCPPCKAKYSKGWAEAQKISHPKRRQAYMRKSGAKVKLEVLTHYGPDGMLGCCWSGCLETDIDMLTLDHVNNDGGGGGGNRRSAGKGFYYKVRKRGFPDGFQTLCANHQLKKEILRRLAV